MFALILTKSLCPSYNTPQSFLRLLAIFFQSFLGFRCWIFHSQWCQLIC